jgi:GrpB-like predicted nucleotidyltransferase (UPF0157 family)
MHSMLPYGTLRGRDLEAVRRMHAFQTGTSTTMPRPVILAPYDPAWPRLAAQEAARIADVLGEELIAIHHIGSTAIPGIKAKPILDLLGVVRSLRFLDQDPGVLDPLDYRPRGEMGIPGRRYFSKSANGPRTHHAHFFQIGDSNIDRHLNFRDYLVAHPAVAREYERLKESLAAKFPMDSPAYSNAKTEFVQEIERTAAEWRRIASA